MARPEDPVKDDIDMTEPLNTNGKLELKYSPLEQETHSRMSELDADNQNLENGLHQREMGSIKYCCCLSVHGEAMLKKKHGCSTRIAIILAITCIALLVSFSFNIIQYVKLKELQTTPTSLCPPNWTMNGETCYFFSDTQRSWNFSQSNCSSYGGSLLTVHSKQEWDFIKKHRRPAEYWINLERKTLDEPWKWPNGSLVDSWFYIGGEGLCAYLNEKAASSTICDNDRYWICSKPISYT